MDFIDLRSDTVTKPTDDMRVAMAGAEVGDDVYGEDPTVNHLQDLAASMLGKESGIFIPSGTMGNLAAILAHCKRGDEVILGKQSHTFLFEAGGISALGGIHSNQIPNQGDGSLALFDIEAAIRSDDPHNPPSRLICLENTHNRCGGTYQTATYVRSVGELAHKKGLSVHLDGARIFNAAVAQGVKAAVLADGVDSVTFCLSKGLCAPVGSVLCGSDEFISKAHRIRKQLGGGMRQAGILAAAGIVALESMVDRLIDDHMRARKLADGLNQVRGLKLDLGTPATNMVFLSLTMGTPMNAMQVASELKSMGVLVGVISASSFRLVTHYWIDDLSVERTIEAFSKTVIV